MTNRYEKIVENNLNTFFSKKESKTPLPAERDGETWLFDAFGKKCRFGPEGIFLNGEKETGVLGILISLYALHSADLPLVIEPLKAFKEFKDSMPYAGAFKSHTEQILVPYVDAIRSAWSGIAEAMGSGETPGSIGGDFNLMVRPLPRIRLCYIFYEADDDFPASVTCLYSSNADRFLPIDALADTGEYASRTIITLL